MSGEINWGPEIAVEGKRPEWLDEGCKVDIKSLDSDRWYSDCTDGLGIGTQHIGWYRARFIRLPADHPHYAAQDAHPAPSGGEVGPEYPKAEIEALVRDMASYYDTGSGNNDHIAEAAMPWMRKARAIVALLPEPVDADRKAAEILTSNWLDATPSQNCVELALAALKKGRELEARNA